MKDYEIIAPIQKIEDMEKLKHVQGIVIGMPFYSVRSLSAFSKGEVLTCIKKGHELHKNVYFLLNKFFMEDELERLKLILTFLKRTDIDGIYFTDMGVYEEAKKLNIQDKLIYDPTTLLTNSMDVNEYLNLEIKRCVLSKEIPLEDMLSIGLKSQGDLEVVIHGRLLMMHSKRELVTSYMEHEQMDLDPKEKTYTIQEESREGHMPIQEDEQGTHVYSSFTLCSFEEVNEIVDANIRYLRIEGLYLSVDDIEDAAKDYVSVLSYEQDGRSLFHEYERKYPQQDIAKGFLYKKTGLKK